MTLAAWAYRATEKFPKHELYGLVSQLRRAAVSIPSNIAEGKGHRVTASSSITCTTRRGSLFELETQLLLAEQLQYISDTGIAEAKQLIAVVAKSLTGLINSLDQQHTAVAATV